MIRIDDKLAVGEPSLRQHVADAAAANAPSEPPSKAANDNAFGHLPLIQQSLDEIIPVSAGVAQPAV